MFPDQRRINSEPPESKAPALRYALRATMIIPLRCLHSLSFIHSTPFHCHHSLRSLLVHCFHSRCCTHHFVLRFIVHSVHLATIHCIHYRSFHSFALVLITTFFVVCTHLFVLRFLFHHSSLRSSFALVFITLFFICIAHSVHSFCLRPFCLCSYLFILHRELQFLTPALLHSYSPSNFLVVSFYSTPFPSVIHCRSCLHSTPLYCQLHSIAPVNCIQF